MINYPAKVVIIMGTYSTQDVAEYSIFNGGGTWLSSLGVITRIDGESVILHSTFAWCVARTPSHPYRNTVTALNTTAFEISDVATGAVWDFVSNHHDGGYFGTWVNGNNLYIDHVELCSLEHAAVKAESMGEKAIYNLITKETISL